MRSWDELVFCGFGEPTVRWDVVRKIAKYVKRNGGRTRLDTNGHGSFINKRNIAPELSGLIDALSISLNASDPRKYSELMKVEPRMFNEVISFAKEAKSCKPSVKPPNTAIVVAMSFLDPTPN